MLQCTMLAYAERFVKRQEDRQNKNRRNKTLGKEGHKY